MEWNGMEWNARSSAKLTSLTIAGDHYRSSIWMQQALRKWNEEEEKKSVEKAEILEYLSFSLYAQGNMRRALREKKSREDAGFTQLFTVHPVARVRRLSKIQ